jgi:uncharacterized protein
MALTTALSFLLVLSLGFFAHRASICLVRSIAEIFSTGRAYMLRSFLKAIVWVIALGLPLTWLIGPPAYGLPAFQIHSGVLIGGLVFGFGATINGGCSISTVTRIGDGNLGMVFALFGIALGALGTVSISVALDWPLAVPISLDPPLAGPTMLGFLLLVPLWLWIIVEIVRMWRGRAAGSSVRNLLL